MVADFLAIAIAWDRTPTRRSGPTRLTEAERPGVMCQDDYSDWRSWLQTSCLCTVPTFMWKTTRTRVCLARMLLPGCDSCWTLRRRTTRTTCCWPLIFSTVTASLRILFPSACRYCAVQDAR